MFVSLKKKLQQGVAQSKAVVSGLAKGDGSSEDISVSDTWTKPMAESTPQKDARHGKPIVEDLYTPVFSVPPKSKRDLNVSSRQLLSNSPSEGSSNTHYETASDVSSLQGDITPKENRSRTSSVSSMISDSTFFPSINLSSSLSTQSDNESELEDTSLNLSSASREELYAFIKRFEQRAFKYKSKFLELATAYKDTLQERDKLKSALALSQDGSPRFASELDQPSQLDLPPKDEHTNLQIQLQKEGKDVSEDLEVNLLSKQGSADSPVPASGGANRSTSSPNKEIDSLNARIKRQDGLLQKCRNTITSYKEKIVQLSKDKEELHSKLELVSKAGDRTNSHTPDQVSRLQAQMHEARKVIQQLELDREVAIAEFKQQIHEEMEQKDAELEHVKIQHHKCVGENHSLKLDLERLTTEVEDLRRINQEQLEKARSIMRKLKDDKKLALEQAEARIRQAELSMEEEKEKMLVDLKRGKAEAFSVMQQESEKNLAETVEAAVEERDRFWKKKFAAQEATHLEVLQAKDREKEMVVATMKNEVRHKMKEKEEDVKLALEERELQKMAALTGLDEQKDRLLLEIEELSSEKIKLTNRFSKFQEDTGHQISQLEDRLKQQEAEHNRHIHEMQLKQEEMLENEKSKLLQKVKEEIESLKQRHAEEIQSLADKHEQEIQESNTEEESYYRSRLESEKVQLENLLAVTRDQLEEMRNAYSVNQTKLTEAELPQNRAEDQLTNRAGNQELLIGVDLKEQVNQTSPQGEDQINRTENQIVQDNCSADQVKTLEQSNIELRLECQALSDELQTMKENLAVAKNKTGSLKTDNYEHEEGHRQVAGQSEYGREGSKEQEVHQLNKQISELNEEHESLNKNAEDSQIKVKDLQRWLDETVMEKKAIECKSREFELQVGQLQEVIRTLESCQNTVEREKASLEQKLTFLENIVDDLKASKEELNEKLHHRHEALVEQFHEEKQAIEQTASELSMQVGSLKEEVAMLNKVLLSNNDENLALRSVVDDNVRFVKSLEATIDKLTADLQAKSQTCTQSEAALAKSLEKFEKLKTEANAKVKGLKEIKDSLTEELNKQQKECEDMRSSLLEKDSQIKAYEEKVIKQQEDIVTLEQTFKEQFEKHRAKFKDVVDKLKEHHESELKEKEKQFDDKLEGTLQTSSDSQCQEVEDISRHIQQISDLQQKLTDKDSSIQSVQAELDNVLLQMKEMSDKHRIEIDTLSLQLAEKDVQMEQLAMRLESQHEHSLPEQGESLTSQIQSLTLLLQEKDKKLESMAGTISAEQESLYKQLSWQTERAEEFHAQKNTLALQLKEAVERLEAQVQDKEALLGDVNQKMVEYTSLKEILQTASSTSLENGTATRSLADQLAEFTEENYSKLHTLESQLEARGNSITVLEDELNSLRDLHEQELAEAARIHSKEIDILKSDWDSQITELQTATQALKSQLKEANEKLQECIQSYEDKLVEEKFQLEKQENLFREEIMVLKQQLHETKSQANASSSLLENVKEGEEKLLSQMQDDLKALEQVAEQKMIDLKQKYTSKLKEIQAQAKRTIEELEDSLNVEKAAKSEMYSELTRANTRLLQLEENTGTSRDTIVDLERKVVEMTALIESRDNELAKLRSDMAESERNMQEILEETQLNCKQINDKLTEAETKLKEDESGLQDMNDQLQTKLELSEEKDRIVKNLENRCLELEISFLQERERLEQAAEETSKRCIELECLLEKTKNELAETLSKFSELDNKFESVSSLSTELQNAQAEKSYLQAELLQLTAEKEELRSKLLVTDSTFEKSLKDHASLVRDLEIKRSEIESKRDEMKQGYEAKLNQLQQAHAADLLQLETQNSTKVAKCKTKAETYVSEMKKQYQEEYNILFDKQQENITKLEETVAILTKEINELKHSKETQAAQSESLIQDLKSRVEEEVRIKESAAETFYKKQQLFEQAEQTLKKAVEKLEEENLLLSEKLNMRCANSEDEKVQFDRETTANDEIFKSDEEEELTTQKTELEETTHKSHQFGLEKQANEQMSELGLDKEAKHATAGQKTDVETMQTQAEGKIELLGQVSELRKEVSEKDTHIKELNAEYQAKIQALETEQDRKVHELQSLLTSTNLEYKQTIGSLEAKLKVEHQKSRQSEDGTHHQQKVVALTQEMTSGNKETFGELQQQVTHLTGHIEQIKQQHKLELADMASRLEARQPTPAQLNMDVFDPTFSPEMHNLELQNMDLQAQVSQLNGELRMYQLKEKNSLRKKDHPDHGRSASDDDDDDDPPLSLDESYMNHTDSAVLREPTEFEYLKNILYEYMMGRETKTLTKVISTVVKFSDEQMKNVLAKADKTVVRKP